MGTWFSLFCEHEDMTVGKMKETNSTEIKLKPVAVHKGVIA